MPKSAVDSLNTAAVLIATVAEAGLPVSEELLADYLAVDRVQVMAEATYQMRVGQRTAAAVVVANQVAAGVPAAAHLLAQYRATEKAVEAALQAWTATTKKTPSDGR